MKSLVECLSSDIFEGLDKEKIFKKIEEINRRIMSLEMESDEIFGEYCDFDEDDNIIDEESFWRNAPFEEQKRSTQIWDEIASLDEQKSKLYKMLQKIN